MNNSTLITKMTEYYKGDSKRIHHYLKVLEFAKTIADIEKVDNNTQEILETAAIVHDIGIKISEEKYGSSNGKYQEKEGPAIARKMLSDLNYDEYLIDRVCYLIAHHHTYNNINGIDYQILVEADFLVNIYEDNLSKDAINKAYNRIFKTKAGKKYLELLYL